MYYDYFQIVNFLLINLPICILKKAQSYNKRDDYLLRLWKYKAAMYVGICYLLM